MRKLSDVIHVQTKNCLKLILTSYSTFALIYVRLLFLTRNKLHLHKIPIALFPVSVVECIE